MNTMRVASGPGSVGGVARIAMAWLSNVLDPELIAVGGGLEVRPASLGEHSAAIGAAILAADRHG